MKLIESFSALDFKNLVLIYIKKIISEGLCKLPQNCLFTFRRCPYLSKKKREIKLGHNDKSNLSLAKVGSNLVLIGVVKKD